jgi:quercetin dioxygenase-like cupin family protein
MAEHYGYCVKGSMTVRMDDGEILNVRAGEAFYLAPGHDAWVEGNETCEMLDFAGYKDYAKRKPESEAA